MSIQINATPWVIEFVDTDGAKAHAEVTLAVVDKTILPKFRLLGDEVARERLARFLALNFADPLVEHDTTLTYPVVSRLHASKGLNTEQAPHYNYRPVFDNVDSFPDRLRTMNRAPAPN
jgi:hypothetical protein